jgi:hypothetical protein
MRKCNTCQHIKRAEIDRRLAAGEPVTRIARAYKLNPSSLDRHRNNCLGLPSSNKIMKEVARGTAALACLPSSLKLNAAYSELLGRIDKIVDQAAQEGSLKTALAGLSSVRQTLDSLARLAVLDRSNDAQSKDAASKSGDLDLTQIAERLIKHFDHEPELKARIAQALLDLDDEQMEDDHEQAA